MIIFINDGTTTRAVDLDPYLTVQELKKNLNLDYTLKKILDGV